MAGDWVKFESATPDKPEVFEIAGALDIDPDAVVGKLLRVWIWFDQHTENGNAPVTVRALLDRKTNVPGFCDAMERAGWMRSDGENLWLPNFGRQNGQTAKNRALTAKRSAKAKERQRSGNAKSNAPSVTRPSPKPLPREEKRREEYSTPQGGPPSSKRKPANAGEVVDYAATQDITEDDARGFFDSMEAGGWTRGGKPLKDWRAALRTWKRNGYLPSQKRGGGGKDNADRLSEGYHSREAI
jgi:hypothetical protein